MKAIKDGRLVLLSATIFTFLFYRESLGINLFIYELLIILWLLYTKKVQLNDPLQLLTSVSSILTAAFSVIHHSTLSFAVNFFVFFLFVGVISAPAIRSLLYITYNSVSSFFISQGLIWKELSFKGVRYKGFNYSFKRMRIFILPVLVIVLFIWIYGASNVKFGNVVNEVSDFIATQLGRLLSYIEFAAITTFIVGLAIGNYVFLRRKNERAAQMDAGKNDELYRTRKKHTRVFKMLALVNEYRSAVFLFISLNVLLLVLNSMDVYWVWFNFEWNGEFLKDFVHKGTYLLLISILISIVLVLYFFRNKLNFYTRNSLLKKLSYLWIFQNLILAFSVGIRNWYYIQHYALAYKRIAIVFFLILVAIGLYTVYLKVRERRSAYYLIRVNSIALLLVFVLSSAFNWDRIIASYNLGKSDRSFVHLNFLADLSDSALPLLDRPEEDIRDMDNKQIKWFNFNTSSSLSLYRRIYLTPEAYTHTIAIRKAKFVNRWESKGFLSWNYAEHRAYNELKKKKG